MPNHVRNDIEIIASAEVLQSIKDFVASGEDAFDFEKIIPMPEEFKNLHSGATTIDGKRYSLWRTIDGKYVGIEPEEIAAWNAKYGAAGWYEWSIQNWGTKWNAYDVEPAILAGECLHYSFDTAWSSPEPVLQALADRFKVEISVMVSGEVDRNYHYTVSPN